MVNKFKTVCLTAAIASSSATFAGGLLTNTNQHVAFNRMMSREASIGIDGVYYNPAGVVFMGEGSHLAINWQMAYQTRTIKNDYKLFTNNVNNPTTPRDFKGKAFAPVIPSFQYAYNKGRWSLQGNFALTGGGGKCTFDNGLGSFEKIVGETAMGAIGLAGAIDHVANTLLTPGYITPENKVDPSKFNPMFTDNKYFGSKGDYSFNSYMHGRQYYFGLSAGAAYKVSDNFSVYAGLRGIYATCNYYGYVKDIKVGNMPLYQVLDPSKENSANIELSCDQSGIGFTPMLAVDYKTGRWNFSAKYEFKTRMRLKNKSVNKLPSIGNLDDNLKDQMTRTLQNKGLPQEQAMQISSAILTDKNVVKTTAGLKQQFDSKINEALGEYADGKKIAGDIPSLLTVGVGYSPIDELRINVGFHWFDDYNATSYNNRNKLLKKRGTLEFNAGVEYDVTKKITVSTGWQNTNYGLTDKYMDDKSFVVGSNSVGLGGVYHITKKLDFSVAYFHTFYNHVKTSETVTLAPGVSNTYNSDYTRNNNAFAAGVNITF
ncbi:OmpP1/FadL family transporter [Leyella stercorea]|jgi:long-chain fatty acid transport protein|uniref:OmpP1/FadL family transporter n=1 Tax=Leyella stercorea TaxID=363265 RepID=UPI003A928F67